MVNLEARVPSTYQKLGGGSENFRELRSIAVPARNQASL